MAGLNMTLQNLPDNSNCDAGENVEKILTVVVKRRKTVPTKCMEINKKTHAFELLRLENAKVITEANLDKDDFRKTIQGFKRLKSFQFTLSDLEEAERKLEKYHKRTKELHSYLESRKKYVK